jgi:Protein of unknown function (DUF2442)
MGENRVFVGKMKDKFSEESVVRSAQWEEWRGLWAGNRDFLMIMINLYFCKAMEATPYQKISAVHFEGDFLVIEAADQIYKWSLSTISPKLSNGSVSERTNFVISPSGYGIHWPLLDEDLSLSGLLKVNCVV